MKAQGQGVSRRSVLAVPLVGIAAVALAARAEAQETAESPSMVVSGVLAYLGVLPAAIVQGHPKGHPEAAMHGGVPDGRHQYHLILALFDAASGKRIEEAGVSVNVMGLGHTGGTRIDLEPMTIADTVTWGAFIELPGRDISELAFEVRLKQRSAAIRFPFTYRHGGP